MLSVMWHYIEKLYAQTIEVKDSKMLTLIEWSSRCDKNADAYTLAVCKHKTENYVPTAIFQQTPIHSTINIGHLQVPFAYFIVPADNRWNLFSHTFTMKTQSLNFRWVSKYLIVLRIHARSLLYLMKCFHSVVIFTHKFA